MKKCSRLSFVLVLFTVFSLLLSSCAPSYTRAQGYAMGTLVAVSTERASTASALLPLVSSLENQISHKVPTSAVAGINRGESVTVSKELLDVLILCQEIEEKTDGAFSAFLLPVTSLWDFENQTVPTPDALALALGAVKNSVLSVSGSTVTLSSGGIDLGAVGKGMAADVLARALREKNETGLVTVGGSIGAVGNKNGDGWRIGVRDPFSASQSDTVGVLCLSDVFVSTSGSYEKSFKKDSTVYHHILDPQTGMPVENELISVTVVAESGVLSDVLSTALFAVGIEAGVSLCAEYGAEALFIKKDGTLYATHGFAAVFTSDGREVTLLEK